jgi:hypothetical protein
MIAKPLSISSRRAVRRAKNVARRAVQRARDSVFASYAFEELADHPLARLIPQGLAFVPAEADLQAVQYFLDHRFDLLGSGWVQVRHEMRCLGFQGVRYDRSGAADNDVNPPNAAAAQAARALISQRYRPIDWQLDFKSGYRWSQRTWYRDVAYGALAGVDVKVPWELSRMQHLPELALAFAHSRDERLAQEFRDQLLDWVSTNPPRFGVNWASTMDVGIRVANWLIAFDMFRAGGAEFDRQFTRLFTASVFDHAAHIVRNLEWSETHRANHYLGNIGGLLLAAAYLPASRHVDAWLLFAIQELLDETQRQFLRDGGHFEASTSYHRLCAEMVAVSAAFACALPRQRIAQALTADHRAMPFGPGLRAQTAARLNANLTATGTVLSVEFFERLARAAELTRSLTRTDGSVPLIGDDDSGRFVRLGGWRIGCDVAGSRAIYGNLEHFRELPDDAPYVMQSHASHQQWLAWASGLLGREDLLDGALSVVWQAPKRLAQGLRSGVAAAVPTFTAQTPATSVAGAPELPSGEVPSGPVPSRLATHAISGTYRPGGEDLLTDVRCEPYPLFGVYILRSTRVHLTIRCGWALHDDAGVHAHEDQLSIDLFVDGRQVAADPGTFAYTSAKRQRIAYRQAQAHYAPAAVEAGASAQDDSQIFSRPRQVRGECLKFDATGFVGRACVEGGEVVRTISFHCDRIDVLDRYWLRAGWCPASEDTFRPAHPVALSPGYGWWLK